MKQIHSSEIVPHAAPGVASFMAAAEIDNQIATAKRFPRDISHFKNKLMTMATTDRDIAAACFYVLPRAGKHIPGPSVRLAELALASYGNIVAQGDISHEDSKHIYAIGMCRDLESNTAVRVTVRRRITNKDGVRYNDDMVMTTGNAAVSIALRNATFKVIPQAFILPVYRTCMDVAAGDAATLNEAKESALHYLATLDVDEPRVLAALRRNSVEDITKADIITLRGFCTAIKEEGIEVETVFPEVADATGNGTIRTQGIPPEDDGKAAKKAAKKTSKKVAQTNIFD